jgi:hypothetical protein
MNNIEKNDLIYIKHKLRKYYNKLQSNPVNKDLYERKIRQYIRIIQEGGVTVKTISGTRDLNGTPKSYFEGLEIQGYKLYKKDDLHPSTDVNIKLYGNTQAADESMKKIVGDIVKIVINPFYFSKINKVGDIFKKQIYFVNIYL